MGGNHPEGGLVKKVRLVMGALGAAVPAVGMMIPPAASAAVQNPGKSVKTVGFFPQVTPAVARSAGSGASSSTPLPGTTTISGMTVRSGTPCTGTSFNTTGSKNWNGTGLLKYEGSMSLFTRVHSGTWTCVGTVNGHLTKVNPNRDIASGWMRVRVRVGANSTLVRTEWAHFNAGSGTRNPSKAVKEWHRAHTVTCVKFFWQRNSLSPVGGKNQVPICFAEG